MLCDAEAAPTRIPNFLRKEIYVFENAWNTKGRGQSEYVRGLRREWETRFGSTQRDHNAGTHQELTPAKDTELLRTPSTGLKSTRTMDDT